MKRILFILLCTMCVLVANAQDRYMRVTQLDGTITKFAVNTIDSIDFVTEEEPETITVVGTLKMISNLCTTEPCMPGLALAISTKYRTTYYITNPYTEEAWNNTLKITTCDKEFIDGEYVLAKGKVTPIDSTRFYLNIDSIEIQDRAPGAAGPMLYTSYVGAYHFPSTMSLTAATFNYGVYPYDSIINSPYGFRVGFNADYTQMVGQWATGGEHKYIFDSLSIKHEDTHFNQDVIFGSSCPDFPHTYLGFDMVSITVTSDADFDEQHLSGTPLNDVVQFIAYTPYPFIQGGYQYATPAYQCSTPNYGRWVEMWRLQKEETTLIDKPLSECTSEDFILTLGWLDNWICGEYIPACYLYIKATPTLSKQHTITVTIVDDAGKTWQNSIKLNWNQ